MREILFKARRTDNGKWVEGFYVFDEAHVIVKSLSYEIVAEGKINFPKANFPEVYVIDPATLCQHTGLTDKNGVKIFEGDVLRGFEYPFLSDGRHNYYAEVLWFENSPAFGICTIKAKDAEISGISAGNTDYMENWRPTYWEIIGNIHDNPELL